MTFTVLIMPAAEAELQEAYDWLVLQTPQHGPIWFNTLLDAILSLEKMPARCPVAPESTEQESVRQLVHGDKRYAYRILFTIRGSNVLVLHIRHAARH